MQTESIGKWISLLYRQSQVYIGRELKPLNLTPSEYIYLIHLGARTGETNQKQLSDLIVIDGALTTRAMKSLERKGFIQRTRSMADQRSIMIRLTDQGRAVLPAIEKTLRGWTETLADGLDEQERSRTVETLMTMSKNALKATRGAYNDKT